MFLMNKFGHSMRPERVYFYLYMVLVVALMFYISLRAAPFIFGRESGKCIVLSGPCVYEVSDGSTGEISLPDRLAVPEGSASVKMIFSRIIRIIRPRVSISTDVSGQVMTGRQAFMKRI